MITKETARRIYNCYQQIEEIDRLKKEMLEEVEKTRKREAESHEPIPDSPFGRFGKGMQLGIPDGQLYRRPDESQNKADEDADEGNVQVLPLECSALHPFIPHELLSECGEYTSDSTGCRGKDAECKRHGISCQKM